MSIGHHILQLLITVFAVMASVMFGFVHILANAAADYDIRKNLEREVFENLNKISLGKDGQIVYEDSFVHEKGDIHFVVLDLNGNILSGKYPEGCPENINLNQKKLRQIPAGREIFFVRDARKRLGKDWRICLRAIVRKSDTYSRYQTLETLAYICIIVIFLIAIAGGWLLSRRISDSLKDMCKSAEAVGRHMNMSGRMEYHGKLYELSVLEQANNRMLDRLEETFRQQEQFTSDVAHELRTPIAVMMAQCQYAHGKTVSREDYQEAFEVIERQSYKVNAIISRLLELSRLDYGRVSIQKEDTDLPEIVQSICEDMQMKSGDRLKIELKLAEARTVGDIGLVMIAIQNLLANAVKYSAEGSLTEVETGIRDGMAFVSVKDHGEGISEENMQHIFKRFYKTDKSRNSEGFGLGLPLAMKIAQKHGGTILAESRLGEGSRFTLLLPVVQESFAEA